MACSFLLYIWVFLVFSILYIISLAIYRLYLSPVSCFPGPRLAALTFWYEFYYDVYSDGRYTWKIIELHRQYGPVVRINPEELHINDPAFYDQIYTNRRTNKWSWSAKMFGTTTAAVGTVDHDLHRMRRAALNPFFSKASVGRLESTIQSNVDLLMARLSGCAGSEEPVNFSDAFTSLSADIIGSYAFGKSYGFLRRPDFAPHWRTLMTDLSRSTHLMKQFGWLYTLSNWIPESVVTFIHPLTADLFKLRQSISDQIESIKQSNRSKVAFDSETIFDGVLCSNLPPNELSTERLMEEGLTILGAGTVTTAHTLSVIFYHLLSNPRLLEAVRSEVQNVCEEGTTLSWKSLSQLPLLTAVVDEGLRLSFGVSHRLQRVSPDLDLVYKDWVIPRGTPVSQTQMLILLDPDIFPMPEKFLPERWLQPADRKDGDSDIDFPPLREAKKFLVPFSRGSRSCLGINLAYAELYLTVGKLLRPRNCGGVDMELFQTGMDEMVIEHDFFNPSPRRGAKGVRVLIR